MRLARQIMGMPISIDIVDCDDEAVFKAVFDKFKAIDEQFSTYKPASEVSRLASGELDEAKISAELKMVIKACRVAENKTGGYFSAWAAGTFDPSGYVKGWAIALAAKVIENKGYKTYCVSAGGDILAASNSGKTWQIGIQDPADKGKILNMLSISNGAVASSGHYERGQHIINQKTGQPASGLLSVTVVGPDIIWADVLATAVFAAGQINPSFLKNFPDYKAQIVSNHSPGNNQ
jgi:FAD:protein FMN transferase